MEIENNFFDLLEENINVEKKYFVLIIYDISENKRRNNLVKILESYGNRVQKSCFEAILKPSKYEKMLKEIEKLSIDTDSIRVYKIQGRGSVVSFGIPYLMEDENVVFI